MSNDDRKEMMKVIFKAHNAFGNALRKAKSMGKATINGDTQSAIVHHEVFMGLEMYMAKMCELLQMGYLENPDLLGDLAVDNHLKFDFTAWPKTFGYSEKTFSDYLEV